MDDLSTDENPEVEIVNHAMELRFTRQCENW